MLVWNPASSLTVLLCSIFSGLTKSFLQVSDLSTGHILECCLLPDAGMPACPARSAAVARAAPGGCRLRRWGRGWRSLVGSAGIALSQPSFPGSSWELFPCCWIWRCWRLLSLCGSGWHSVTRRGSGSATFLAERRTLCWQAHFMGIAAFWELHTGGVCVCSLCIAAIFSCLLELCLELGETGSGKWAGTCF